MTNSLTTSLPSFGFAELASKSNYSFLEGASHPEEMVLTAKAWGYEAIALCDRNGVYGAPRAHVAAKNVGIRLIIGAEITIDSTRLLLLCQNREGYGNLCELLTALHCQFEEKLPWTELYKYTPGLFCLWPVQNPDAGSLSELKVHFKDDLYLLVGSFLDGRDLYLQRRAQENSAHYEIPVLATNEPLFHTPLRKPLQDVLTCIRHTCPLPEAGHRLLPNAERTLKPISEIYSLFATHPEWVRNTLTVANRCHFSLDEIKYHYPQEWIPEGETGNGYLAKLVWQGAHKRYGEILPLEVQNQIRAELSLISDLEYADYFLTIWDIVQFATKEKILHQGRGSAANSLVCYLLGITAIDPIRMNLLFERFISRERAEPPDIDIDFEHERREEVIQYIYGRYGRHRAAITAEVICFRRKSSLREVAKVFGLSLDSVEKLLLVTHRRSFSEVDLKEFQVALPEIPFEKLKMYLAISNEIFGFPRHLGTHVGGFVLCHDTLTRNVPVEKAAMPDRTIVQWDKNDLDALGFVRVDILGLGILTCIRKCFDLIEKKYGPKFTLANLPAEDPKVYDSFCQADTVGVFQIESRAQMNMLPRVKPRNFFDLVVEISIVRPGPIQGEMVHPYLRRRAGKEKVEQIHPELNKILDKTYGVPLFQEQIMKMAMHVAGFSGGEADELRRAMGTWRKQGKNRLTEMGNKFCTGLVARGIEETFARRVFQQIEGFAEYGFPESHAASFSILAYASGYLRLYYPDAFLCAILNAQPMGFYQSHTLIGDGQRHGVTILPVDAQHSHWDNTLETPGAVRLGFREIHGLNKKVSLAIETAREKNRFFSLLDLVSRVKEVLSPTALTKRDLFFLASSNAFESLGYPRREALWEIQSFPLQDSNLFLQSSLVKEEIKLPKERPWEKISQDFQNVGVSLHTHPMEHFRSKLEGIGVLPSKSLLPPASRFLAKGRRIKVAGIVICRQMPPTASGVLFISLEDEFGFFNLVVWNNVYQKYREILLTHSFLLAEGKIDKPEDAEVVHVIVEHVTPLLGPIASPLSVRSHDFN